ncbi:MAG: polysaccharide deacetylase family protein, partial [Granulosicoccus sp.]
MSGNFLISLDFELMWGVRDHRSVADYGDAVLGGRIAIPEILTRFQSSGIRATWATVGLLFARNRDEMLEYAPKILPGYANSTFCPYRELENGSVGENERLDPLHFGLSLIDQIVETPGQEIATHTYSHYYCLESGQTNTAFEADLLSARAIAEKRGLTLRSLVYPRNQNAPEHAQIAAALGIDVYRGDAPGWLYRSRSNDRVKLPLRLLRILDGVLPISNTLSLKHTKNGIATNVPASRFLRPWLKNSGFYNIMHIRRIQNEIKAAA